MNVFHVINQTRGLTFFAGVDPGAYKIRETRERVFTDLFEAFLEPKEPVAVRLTGY